MQKLFFILFLGFALSATAQQDRADANTASNGDIPVVSIFTIDNVPFDTKDIDNDGKPIVIDFWATWCKPCIKELNAINDHYAKWQKETGVKIYAVTIDDKRTESEVKPLVNSTWEWDYEILKDINSDLKRAMNVNNIPHVFLLDGNKKIVSQHTTYAPGDENHLYEEIKKLVGKTETTDEAPKTKEEAPKTKE